MSDNDLKCWVCGESGARLERTLLGFKKPVCPSGQGCSSSQTPR